MWQLINSNHSHCPRPHHPHPPPHPHPHHHHHQHHHHHRHRHRHRHHHPAKTSRYLPFLGLLHLGVYCLRVHDSLHIPAEEETMARG